MNNCKSFAQNLTDFLKAMGNEKRQEIILCLFSKGEEHNIGDVAVKAGIAQSTASEHLSMLKRAGILVSRKAEKEVFYKLNKSGIVKIIDEIKAQLNCCG